MALFARFSRRAIDLKTIHHRCARAPSFLSRFCTATESASDTEQKEEEYQPPLIGIALAKKVGRASFASQNLVAGDVLHAAKPMVVHPCLSKMNCLCYYCLRFLPKRDTSADAPDTVSFCSDECEQEAKKFYDVEKQADWSRFHEYCREQGLKFPLIAKRFACQIISRRIPYDFFELLNKAKLSSEQISPLKDEFALLNSIIKDADIKVEDDEEEDQANEKAAGNDEQEDAANENKVENDKQEDPANEKKDPFAFLTEEWYVDTMARITGNALKIELSAQPDKDLESSATASVEGKVAVGNGMYMLPSFYNHSCDPNVSIEWTDNALGKMVALREIEEGEEVRISYLDTSMDFEARKKYLYERYKFECDCPRCVPQED